MLMPTTISAWRWRKRAAAAHFNLGIALARQGQVDAAIAQFTNALQIKPDFAEARQALEQAVSVKQPPAQ